MLSRRAFIEAARLSATRSAIGARAVAGPAYRTFATPTAPANPKPPVALYGLDGTYASALVCQGNATLLLWCWA